MTIDVTHSYFLDDLKVLEDELNSCIEWVQEITDILMNENGEVPEEIRKVRSNLVMAAIEIRKLIESEDI